MAFTPSNLAIANVGSLKLTIATQVSNTASGTDLWSSGIQDIQAIIPYYTGDISATGETSTVFAVSFTASSGVIHIIRDASNTGTPFTLLVMSGLAVDMT